MELKLFVNYQDKARSVKKIKYTYNKPLADAVTSEDFLVDIPDDNIISVSDEDVLLDLPESFEPISFVKTLTGTDFPYLISILTELNILENVFLYSREKEP